MKAKKKKIMAIWQIMENDDMYLDQTQEEGVERVTFFPPFFWETQNLYDY